MRRVRRIRWGYYLFKASTSYGFIVPFSVIYLEHQGYGLDVIGYTQAAFLFAAVAAEIPTGYVADRIGRRRGLAFGNALTAAVMAGYTLVGSVGGWVALYGLWGLAWSFHSAIGDAWLYRLLEARTDADAGSFAGVSGRAESVELVVSAGAAVAAAGLYTLHPDLPFLANAVLAALGIPAVLWLPAAGDGDGARLSPRAVLRAIRLQLRRPEIRWLVAYSALFNALFSMTRWLEQPALEAVGVPLAGFGLLYASFKVVSAGAMTTTGWVQARLGPRAFFLALIPLVGLVYGAVALLPGLVLPVIYLRRVLDRLSTPVRNQYLNDRLAEAGRATVLSATSMALSLASGLSSAVLGPVADAVGPTEFLPAAGLVVAVAGVILWLVVDPVRGPTASGPSVPPGDVLDPRRADGD